MIAHTLDAPLDSESSPRLQVTPERVELIMPGFSPLFVDFGESLWKSRQQAGKKQGLIQACKPKHDLLILDATAGWGRDAAILASFGATVLMLERNPIMGILLEDGLARLDEHSPIHSRLSMVAQDAMTYLKQAPDADRPDVIYLDPMHPQRQKTALVKKEMQALQQLLGHDADAKELLMIARSTARQKVVVKWPSRESPMMPPTQSYSGKTVRFDVYLT